MRIFFSQMHNMRDYNHRRLASDKIWPQDGRSFRQKVSFSPCIMCVQYRGGCSVPWGVFSTVGGYHEYRGGYLEYRGGCSVPWGIS